MAMIHTRSPLLFFLALPCFFGEALTRPRKVSRLAPADSHREALGLKPFHSYKEDCGKKTPIALSARVATVYKKTVADTKAKKADKIMPGSAGMNPDEIEPFAKVLKDGFLEVDCVKDYMLEHGDAHGDNKLSYKLADSSNVSIVLYKDLVPSEDRKPMTQRVCFEFCRTVPEMLFFGMNAGECYCTPFYKPMAGASSQCDASCPGDNTQVCGGMDKSAMFAMHLCADTASDLTSAIEKAGEISGMMIQIGEDALTEAGEMQEAAAAMQATFSADGNPVAGDLLQQAKVFSGGFEKSAAETKKIGEKLDELSAEAESVKSGGGDFTDPEALADAEKVLRSIEENMAEGEASFEKTTELFGLAAGGEAPEDMTLAEEGPPAEEEGEEEGPPAKEEEEGPEISEAAEDLGPLGTYRPLMYFVDDGHAEVPHTCGGDLFEKPMQVSAETCAESCDAALNKCDGFGFYPHFDDGSGVCFKFSKLKSVTYYTGCEEGGEFLQAPKNETSSTAVATQKAAFLGKSTPAEEDPEIDKAFWGKFEEQRARLFDKRKTGIKKAHWKRKPRARRTATKVKPVVGAGQFHALKAGKAFGKTSRALLNARKKKKEGAEVVTCFAKLTRFQGINLSPKGDGKCKMCLKEAVNAKRCFE